MIAFAAALLHWGIPLLIAATAAFLILLARTLPSQPAEYDASNPPRPRLPEQAVSEKNQLAEASVIHDARGC